MLCWLKWNFHLGARTGIQLDHTRAISLHATDGEYSGEILPVQVCDVVAGRSTVTTITNNILESFDYAYINKYTYRLRWAVMMT